MRRNTNWDILTDAVGRGAEIRLCWTGPKGGPVNGGTGDPAPLPTADAPGEWQPEIPDPILYERGYHTTTDPLRWTGEKLWWCEVSGAGGCEDDKEVWSHRRLLTPVDPRMLLSASREWVALHRPDLTRANLTGANLTCAQLPGAILFDANLTRADLTRAHLSGVELSSADLSYAILTDADLSYATLSGADLSGAVIDDGKGHLFVLG